jgi:beta-1,4-N-acetylglucosaminyltransferase
VSDIVLGKICFVASSGGHLEEIARLAELKNKYESFMITEKGQFQELNMCERIYYVSQLNRKEPLFVVKFIVLFILSLYILVKEKPDYIISTGALATYPICIIGKILRKKIIYIESFARVDSPSLTGKLMYKLADLFIVQWEEMLQIYPKAKYGGGIF